MILLILILIFIIFTITFYMMDTVQSFGEEKIKSIDKLPHDIGAILVLGAGVKKEGKPCEILKDRLNTAIKVYSSIENAKLLLSGDHSRVDYDEVGTMKRYIMSKNKEVEESDIFLDHLGFSTYESIYRAKIIFKVEKVVIVTNDYHLPRALYIAEKMGIKAYGIPSDNKEYEEIELYKARELLAQVKDYIYVNILKIKPKYLDSEIPLDSTDGKITNNK